ncbi:hypothetical protein Tco_0606692 [Tanacetum coccineum]
MPTKLEAKVGRQAAEMYLFGFRNEPYRKGQICCWPHFEEACLDMDGIPSYWDDDYLIKMQLSYSGKKASKYIERGHQLFVAHVTEKEPKEKRLEDIPVIQNFLEVFPDDLPRLPPPRQVEFKMGLV